MSTESVSPARASQQVFVCYRREETAAHAGRVYDAMVSRFGERNVFMDIDMEPGVDFVERITEVVSGCVALIVVMGPGWATVTDEDGTRRIEDPDDFVRLEVETGLRNGVHVIPALVHGARMPRRESLPPELRSLARRNALEMSDGRWGYDVGRLLTALDERVTDENEIPPMGPAGEQEQEEAEVPVPQPPIPRWRLIGEGVLIAGLTGALVRAAAWQISVPHGDSETGAQILGTAARQGCVGACVGLALAIWLALRLERPGLPLLRGLLLGAAGGVLAGAILGYLVFHPTPNKAPQEALKAAMISAPVAGAFLGGLLGSLWRPARIVPALLAGAAGAFLFALFAHLVELNNEVHANVDLLFGLTAAAATGLALAVLLLLDRREAAAG